MKNPWTQQRLEDEFLGREESFTLEFKSSRALLQDKVEAFVNDLSCHIGAFLNSEGGLLIVGIEEAPQRDKKRAELAERISDGVPRSRMTGARLLSMLCDRISPVVTSLVQVHSVKVGECVGEDLLAFVIEVRPGVTAYQSADKKYYGRRSFSSNPLEDKEIRLRMLADERPRAKVTISVDATPIEGSWPPLENEWRKWRDMIAAAKADGSLKPSSEGLSPEELVDRHERFISTRPRQPHLGIFYVRVHLLNTGVVTIRRSAIQATLEGTLPPIIRVTGEQLEKLVDVRFEDEGEIPLYPERTSQVAAWKFEFERGKKISEEEYSLRLSVIAYLDGGLAVREVMDLRAALKEEYARFEQHLADLER